MASPSIVWQPAALASRRSSDPPGGGERAAPRDGESTSQARRRVLIVEDYEETRELYAWCMRAAGWRVETARNGVEAMVMASTLAPDVIVMDVSLPIVDGIEVTRRLKADERTAHIPVVACSAYVLEREADIREAGFALIVPKPVTAEDLRDAVEALVEARRRDGEPT